MNRKKKILVFVDWYLPGYKAGGPIRSVANMVSQLRDEYDFRIVTSDTDLHEEKPYAGIKKGEWTKGPDGCDVLYLPAEKRNYKEIESIIREERADFIYLNSVFSKVFTIYPLLVRKRHFPVRKVILAPRGMLGAGALKIKGTKKKLFLLWSKISGLCRNIRWHASSVEEEKEIRKVFGKNANVSVALNLSKSRSLVFNQRVKKPGWIKAVFLSRISYKKNLEGTLQLLRQARQGLEIEFDIYGPVEDMEYWRCCEELIKSMPSHVRVLYKGALPNEKVEETLQQYHVSFLLTFNENFGHSIIESMAAGCLAFISDQTPWKGLEKARAGWDIPLRDEKKIAEALEHVIRMDQAEYDTWCRSAIAYADRVINQSESLQQHRALFS
ncbi:MAG: glycosyltransferase [Bacteroidia bacterium]|nr:glycosyltransferase [Bacteroidia bacterium]